MFVRLLYQLCKFLPNYEAISTNENFWHGSALQKKCNPHLIGQQQYRQCLDKRSNSVTHKSKKAMTENCISCSPPSELSTNITTLLTSKVRQSGHYHLFKCFGSRSLAGDCWQVAEGCFCSPSQLLVFVAHKIEQNIIQVCSLAQGPGTRLVHSHVLLVEWPITIGR